MRTFLKRVAVGRRLIVGLAAAVCCAALVPHYIFAPWGFYWKVPQEEAALRQQVVRTALAYLGHNEADGSHRAIIDLYNAHEPLAMGYTVRYDDSWCATFVSAVAITCGLTDIIPTECGCERQIGLFQELGRWEERDGAIPLPGDVIYFDWDQRGLGDCTGWADHVGIVVGVKWPLILTVEGNKDDQVALRVLPINHCHIRGYGQPDYASKIESTP